MLLDFVKVALFEEDTPEQALLKDNILKRVPHLHKSVKDSIADYIIERKRK